MSNNILSRDISATFPFDWLDLDYLPNSDGYRVEIYLRDSMDIEADLISMFNRLFRLYKERLKIYNSSWWDFCLDTWNIHDESYNYDFYGKSQNSQSYLQILSESKIEIGYSGICKCNNWDQFLAVILKCILSNEAPYSPFIFDELNEFVFYFHGTGSIGLLYKGKNDDVSRLLKNEDYLYVVK